MKDRLYRSRGKRVLGGVAGGLGDYLNIDPVIIRILIVFLTLFNGVGVLVYIVMWIVVPEEPVENGFESKSSSENAETVEVNNPAEEKPAGKGRIVFGIILIMIGLLFFAEKFIPAIGFWDIVPLIFILFGIYLLWNSFNKTSGEKL